MERFVSFTKPEKLILIKALDWFYLDLKRSSEPEGAKKLILPIVLNMLNELKSKEN